MKKTFTLTLLLVLSTSAVLAATRTKAQMQAAARQAINQQRSARHLAPSATPLEVLRSTEQLEVIGTEDGGFAVIAADDAMPAVLGVSTAHYSNGQNRNFEWWLQATAEAARQQARRNSPLLVTTPDPGLYPVEVTPMVTTKWDQDTPYNNMCPTFSGAVKCLTGCVATAMAQVLNYHQSPEHGIGHRTIYYPQGVTSGEAVTANFENDYYDWVNMLDIYAGVSYTEEQANAVALLMRDCGVAADMQYGGPYEGSGAYSTDAAWGLRTYFGYQDAECLERDNFSEPVWMNLVYQELSENGPLYYGGASWVDGGHAFVLDGYDAEGKVSVNWGWSGDEDGYYLISQLDPSSYHFNLGQDMIVGIKSGKKRVTRTTDVTVTTAGELRELLEASEEEGVIASLTVSGPLNADDMAYLRFLAGWDADGEPTEGRLHILDLTNAKLENNMLPDSIFKDCITLRRVRLPETITKLGDKAFNGCRGLAELRVTTKAVPDLVGNSVFRGMPMGTAKLFVRSGLKTKYVQAAQWGDFGEKNIFQVGTSVKVRNAIRYYGEENPEFFYNVTGDNIEGKPVLTCEASQWSPAGRYPIHIYAGTVVNSEAVNFIDGYMIVRKVEGAKATVVNASREEGEPNPEFKLRYTGLLSHDSEPTWLEEPQFYTEADENSPAGRYKVTVVSGEAESYVMTFKDGTLTVKAKSIPNGIADLDATRNDAPVYNLQGQRVETSRKGLYIKDGKKVMK